MFLKFKKFWEENQEIICASVIIMNGGDYRPFID